MSPRSSTRSDSSATRRSAPDSGPPSSPGSDDPSGVSHTERIYVTVDLAQGWLDASAHAPNRSISESHVSYLRGQMENGFWRESGEPIILSTEGVILNGQHRLTAIVRSKIPQWMLVVYDVPPENIDVMDSGKIRSAADVISMDSPFRALSKAAALKILLLLEHGNERPFANTNTAQKISPIEMRAAQARYKDLDGALRRASKMRRAHMPGGEGVWAALLLRFARFDDDACSKFVHAVAMGVDLPERSPLWLLRHRLEEIATNAYQGPKPDRETLAAWAIKSWNAWRTNEPISVLRWDKHKGEPFPKPV